MSRTIGLLRAALRRARSDWAVLLGAGLLLLASVTLIAATSLYGDAVGVGGLRSSIAAAGPVDRTVVVRTSAFGTDLVTVDRTLRTEITRALGSTEAEVVLVARSDPFGPPGSTDPESATVLAAFEDVDRHAALAGGRWPSPGATPIEATVSEGAAVAMGLAPGARLTLVNRLEAGAQPLELLVVGVWRPDRSDPYWLDRALELDGVASGSDYAARGPVLVDAADLVRPGLTRHVALEWRVVPVAGALRTDAIGGLRTFAQGLAIRLAPIAGADRTVSVVSGLPDLLTAVERSILVSRAGIALLTIQFGVLAIYATLLVAGMLAERRRAETALLRSRGGTGGDLAVLAFLEAVLLAIPAVLIAPPLAAAIVMAVAPGDSPPPAPDAALVPAIVAGLVAVAALVLPSLAAGLDAGSAPGRARAALARPLGRTFGQRLGVDVVLLVLAAIALWQLRLYGAPITRDVGGEFGVDPLLVAAPAIGLLAGGVLAIRVVPRLAEIGERLVRRRHDLLVPLGARQLARRPLRYTPSALLLLLAAALGTFAASYDATWNRSQAEQAAYRAAGDLRLTAGTGRVLRGWQLGPALRALPDVRGVTAIGRGTADAGTAVRQADLLLVDAVGAAAVIREVPGSDGGPTPAAVLAPIAAARSATPGVPIPAGTRAISIGLTADLRVPGHEDERDGTVAVAVVIAGPDGLTRLEAEAPRSFGPDEGLAVVPLTAGVAGVRVALAGDLFLVGLEFAIGAPAPADVEGRLGLGAVRAEEAALPFAPGATGWTWERLLGSRFRPVAALEGQPGTVAVGRTSSGAGGAPGVGSVAFATRSDPPVTVRYTVRQAIGGTVAGIANAAFIAGAAASVGGDIRVGIGGEQVAVHLVAGTAAFPPLDPARPFLVLDSLPLQLVRYASSGQVSPPREWWLDVDDAAIPAVARFVAQPPFSGTDIVSRPALAAALASDPVPLGVIGALVIGALAAVVIAAIGFVMSATASISERLGEFALLRALGVSGRSISAWLVVEQALLLAFGLVVGTALGVLLAWLVLPFASLTSGGRLPVPPPVVVVPWAQMAPVWLASTAILGLAAAVLARRMRGLSLSGLLRTRDG